MLTITDAEGLTITGDGHSASMVHTLLQAMTKEQIERGLDMMLRRMYEIHMGGKREDLWRDYATLRPEDQVEIRQEIQRKKNKP